MFVQHQLFQVLFSMVLMVCFFSSVLAEGMCVWLNGMGMNCTLGVLSCHAHTYVYIIITMPFLSWLPSLTHTLCKCSWSVSCGGSGWAAAVRSCSNRIYSSRVSKKTDCTSSVLILLLILTMLPYSLTSVRVKCFQHHCYCCCSLHSLE